MTEFSKQKDKNHLIINKFYKNFTKYKQCLIVNLENVTSDQVQQTRLALRKQNKGEIIFAKNTLVKKAIDIRLKSPHINDPDYEFKKAYYTKVPRIKNLLKYCKGKIGFIFSDSPIHEIKSIIESNRIPAPAKVGTIAPNDFVLAPGPTGLDPSHINFFFALSIPVTIERGQIQMIRESRMFDKGHEVGRWEAGLLEKLGIKPFTYGLEILYVYDDGVILTPDIFNIQPEAIIDIFKNAASNITTISLAIGCPNILSVPHMIVNGLKNLTSIALAADIESELLGGVSIILAPTRTDTVPTQAKKQVAWSPLEMKIEEGDEEIEFGDIFADDY